jgi:DNA helicase II / ATP-dependent DNA helicase PcrA
MITLTSEQKAAVSYPGNIFLSACPGSGKTRVIVAKLLALAEQVVGSPQVVGCITYTNAAVDEIEDRLKQFGTSAIVDNAEVATIHSFCLQFILRPYRWLAPEVPQAFRILTRESSDFERLVRTVEDEIRRAVRPQTYDDYAAISMGLNGQPTGVGIRSGIVTVATARRFWELMRRSEYIDFSMILYYSYQLLVSYPFIARGISSRFAWLLVDEFQDTSDVQIEIFKLLYAQNSTDFFLVRDENQSIFGFAGARPDQASQFADHVGANRELSLSGNFRSGPEIVRLAERLIPRIPSMHSEGAARHFRDAPRYVHVAQPIDAVTDYFLPWIADHRIDLGRAAILAPWWQHLVPIARRLRDMGVPVFGPGARPYQRRRLFASLAEQLGACVEAGHLLGVLGVEKAIFGLLQDVLGVARFDVFSYEGRTTALSLVYEAKRLAEYEQGGMRWLEDCSAACANILINDGWLDENARKALTLSVHDMRQDMQRRNVDIANLQIADLGLFANPERALKLITFHNSKGREYDAAALICVNEGRIPHFTARTQGEFDEARRLFYVGISRGKIV